MKKGRLNLEGAYPPMPESFLERMQDTLKEAESMKKRRKMTVSLIAAMVAALLLASVGLAQAVDSGILNRLFGGEPTDEAAGLLQTGVEVYEQDGITLSVDEILFDGMSVNGQWTVSSGREEDVLVRVHAELASGEDLSGRMIGMESSMHLGLAALLGESVSSLVDRTALPDYLDERNLSGYAKWLFAESAADVPMEMIITVTAYTTDLELTAGTELYPSREMCEAFEKAGQIGVSKHGVAAVEDYPSFIEAERRLADGQTEDEAILEAAHEAAYEESGLLKKMTEFTVSVPLMDAGAETVEFGPGVYEMDVCTLEVERASVSPAAVSMELKAKTNGKNDESQCVFAVGTEAGPWQMNASGGVEAGEDGEEYLLITLDGLPVSEVPEEIILVRVGERLRFDELEAQWKELLDTLPAERIVRMGRAE